jgi:ADP-ribose pyrophosphatase YjhB (NUDIX family)
VHLTEEILADARRRFGDPLRLDWHGEVSPREYALATYNPLRTHDVTLFIRNGDRLALIRKPHFADGVWRPPGGGIKPGEDIAAGAAREALEETGLRVEVTRYLVDAHACFRCEGAELAWRTHVFLAATDDEEPAPRDTDEIAAARWGTLEELAGPLRARLLETGHAFWRYRVALHDRALEALADDDPSGRSGSAGSCSSRCRA